MMKKLITIFFAATLCLALTSCGGGGDDAPAQTNPPGSNQGNNDPGQSDPSNPEPVGPETPVYPTYDAPQFKADGMENKYDNNMTVYVVLPDNLLSEPVSGDELAVFCGEECRGVAYRELLSDNKYVWMAMVYGNDGDALTFRYWSKAKGYMYNTAPVVMFKADESYGNPDNPMTLALDIVKE